VRCGLVVPATLDGRAPEIAELRAIAEFGDASLFDSIWVSDHLLWRSPMLDPTVAMASLLALSTRITVGTAVLQLPLRRPLDVAKSFGSLSYLSGGRVILGVGAGGDFPLEWSAAGVDLATRGPRCDEAIGMLEHLWRGTVADGTYSTSPGLAVDPGPVAPVPIWVGGRGPAAVRRAARCDGALPIWISPQRLQAMRAEIAELRESMAGFTMGTQVFVRVGTDTTSATDDAMQYLSGELGSDASFARRYVVSGPPERIVESVAEYAAAGADHISFHLLGDPWWAQVEAVAQKIVPALVGIARAEGRPPM
jgi:alkanesulfonate monooxygenase SsuD/methylene tetrahydromethanopterin reductase-like flavin-dependent oxidoreductase (luciferase family)